MKTAMKKRVLILVCLVLFISLSFGVDAALKESLGNVFDSISGWFQNGGWKNHTKIIDFFIWFIIFLSAAMMSFTKLAGDNTNRNVYVGLSIGVALALSFALITQEKFSLSQFLFPFAKYFLVFLATIAFFYIWKSIMPNHGVWAFILALVTVFILFGVINSYVNEDGFLGWVGSSETGSNEQTSDGFIDNRGSSGTSDNSGSSNSGTTTTPTVKTSKCEEYNSRITSFIVNINEYDYGQLDGLLKLSDDALISVVFTHSNGYDVDPVKYKECIKERLNEIREYAKNKKPLEEKRIVDEINANIAKITSLAKGDLENNIETAEELLNKIKTLRSKLKADE